MSAGVSTWPSWNLTPSRSVNSQRFGFAGSTFHSVARHGISTDGFSALVRSHMISWS